MAQYTYQPLPPSHFRILIIHPGSTGDILSCSLHYSSLSQPFTVFEALSYVWGDEAKPYHVLCDGKELRVTTSVWNALHELRLPQYMRVIWIDAICIDLENLQERAHQVQHMHQIYERATRVVIWLGQEDEAMSRAFGLIEQFTISVSEYLDEISDVYDPQVKHWILEKGVSFFGSSNRSDLQNFFENPWFMRAWVFQEAVCAKEAVVQCGSLKLDFRLLELFAVIFMVNNLVTLLSTETSRKSHHQLYIMRNVRRVYARGERDSLFRLLVGSAGPGARDARDQLFSLAGISAVRALPYPPNYTTDVVTWYRDFSAYAMCTDPGLEALAQCFRQQERLPGLPTWAIDWTGSRYFPYQGNHPSHVFDADGKNGSIQQLKFENDKLTLKGYAVDVIAECGTEVYAEAIADVDESIEEARHLRADAITGQIRECIILGERIPAYSSDADQLWQVLWRTLIGDVTIKQNLENRRVEQDFEQAMDQFKPITTSNQGEPDIDFLRQPQAIQMEIFSAIHRVSFKRRFCITEGGRLGWVPKYAQTGDVIAIVAGVGIPMVLRSALSNCYEVIGSSYIHGIMDGELADRSRLQAEKLQLI